MSAPSAVQLAAATERSGRSPMCSVATGAAVRERHQSRSSFPVRLMKTVSRLGSAIEKSRIENPPRSAAVTILGTRRSLPFTWSCRAPSTVRARVMSLKGALQELP